MRWHREVAQVTEVLLSSNEELTIDELATYAHTSNNANFDHYSRHQKLKVFPSN